MKKFVCPHCKTEVELTDCRTIKKYDEKTQIPVGYLAMVFSPKNKGLLYKFCDGKLREVVNTKSGEIVGEVMLFKKIQL